MKKLFILSIAFVFIISIVLTGCQAKPAQVGETITLTALSFQDKSMNSSAFFQRWVDRVNKAADGELVIEYRGGPEVMSPKDLPDGVIKGVVDMMSEPATLYTSLMPTAPAFSFTDLSPREQRKSGYYDFFVDRHKEIGLYYIGRPKTTQPSIIVASKLAQTPKDFAGMKFGLASSTCVSFVEALNAGCVMMSYEEYYTAFEQGVIEATVDAIDTIVDFGLLEVINYVYDHELYAAARLAVSMNLDRWNSLPAHLQKLLVDTMAEHEMEVIGEEQKLREESMAKVKADPATEIITFSPADAEWLVNLAYGVEWDKLKAKIPQEQYDLLRKVASGK